VFLVFVKRRINVVSQVFLYIFCNISVGTKSFSCWSCFHIINNEIRSHNLSIVCKLTNEIYILDLH
jgi:hypothetical protein